MLFEIIVRFQTRIHTCDHFLIIISHVASVISSCNPFTMNETLSSSCRNKKNSTLSSCVEWLHFASQQRSSFIFVTGAHSKFLISDGFSCSLQHILIKLQREIPFMRWHFERRVDDKVLRFEARSRFDFPSGWTFCTLVAYQRSYESLVKRWICYTFGALFAQCTSKGSVE